LIDARHGSGEDYPQVREESEARLRFIVTGKRHGSDEERSVEEQGTMGIRKCGKKAKQYEAETCHEGQKVWK
jgi:hypothetical protein